MLSLGVVPKTTSFGFPIKNGSVALFDDARLVVAIPEERLTRKKNDCGSSAGIRYVLDNVLNGSLPDAVTTSSCCELAGDAGFDDKLLPPLMIPSIVRSPSHHFSHALVSYCLSPFDRALVLVADAGGSTEVKPISHGEWWTVPREQLTAYLAEDGTLTRVYRAFTDPFEWGVGECYRAFTHFLGFGGQTHSGKTMGLAAFGRASQIRGPLFEFVADGRLRSRLEMGNPDDTVGAVRRFLLSAGLSLPAEGEFDLRDERHCDIAAFIQSETQRALGQLVAHLVKRYHVGNVCLGGGVALNCPANSEIWTCPSVKSVFVPPCAGDDGQSVGNALLPIWMGSGGKKPDVSFQSAFWGPDVTITEEEITAALNKAGVVGDIVQDDQRFSQTAQVLAEGHILGWLQGRSEVGPRALGHRSILADARRAEVRRRLSHWIKGREPFRPYAASVLAEKCGFWFKLAAPNPFMLFTGEMRAHTHEIAIALRHPDRSCRVQTVDGTVSTLRQLLLSFDKITGVPFLLNTSLNRAGEPIVETLAEAIEVLRNTDLDGLVAGQFVLLKRVRGGAQSLVTLPDVSFERPVDESARRTLQRLYPERPFVERSYFGLKREYCDWIVSGRKTTTVRYRAGALDLPSRKVLPVVAVPGGETCFAVKIKSARICQYARLTLLDAKRDGFHSLRALRDALSGFYGSIGDDEPVTIYGLELLPGFESLRGKKIARL